jgi:uncharacterized protein (TIGR03083 family)
MDVTRSEFEDLVGAYALDACDPEEAAAMDVYVADHEEAAAEAERLRVVAAWLGAAGALHPPIGLRDQLLAAATEPVTALPPVDALRRESVRFEMLLDSLEDGDLTTITENGLSVRDLVTHVAIIDEAFVAAATESSVFIGADLVAELTTAQLPETADWSFVQIRDRVRSARAALVALDAQYPAETRVGGYSLGSVLVIRAFETWTHCHDIAVATGRPEPPAEPPVLRTMADLAVETLPLALAARGFSYPDRTARVVLTGPGGGDWTIACDGRGTPGPVPDVVLRAPVVEFCRRFADRLTVDEVPFDADGDVELGRALVDAAPAFAGL